MKLEANFRRFAVFAACAFWCAPAARSATGFPVVNSEEWTIRVPDVPKANVSVLILSSTKAPLYRLQCHSGGYEGDPDFDYSGDFECRLTSVGDHDQYSTLLTEDQNQNRDWESRARFFLVDIVGRCAQIPEFGSTRDFELRGMKLTLKIINPIIDKEGSLTSLELKVAVEPDPLAYRMIAAIVPLPKSAPSQCMVDRYFPDPARYGKSQ